MSLADFAGRRHSEEWGTTLARRSLREIVGREEAQRWIEQVRMRSRIAAAISQAPITAKGLAQVDRLVEVRAMRQEDVRSLLESMRQARILPAVERHFLKHGMKLSVADVREYQDALIAHLKRRDLQVFTYVTSKTTHDRMWTFVGMDNGVIAQYNESKKTLWSLYRQADVQKYLTSGRGWWIQVEEDEAGIRFELW
ncbi:MAG: hypothetical protein IT329_07450 [Caldilineaceae bacterium]|nr:hypothetical protein [Caldilineaceae bacterium]